jgi:prepilin-type N-terminal cleavage/methylation domain-containing protein
MAFLNTRLRRLPPLSSAPSSCKRRAFTLVELMVVIAIIAILAGLVLSAAGLVRSRMDSVQCLSQLRQIGVGVGAYISDHNGILPGPLNYQQGAVYVPNEAGSLPALLENYLGTASLTAPDGVSRYSPIFECPAAARKLNDPTKPTYMVNMLPLPDIGQSPWGDITLNQEPLPKAALSHWWLASTGGAALTLPEIWAIQDADQSYIAQVPGIYNGPVANLLPTQAHGDHWNDLFFDFHAESRTTLIEVLLPAASTPPPSGSPGSP